MERDSQDTPDTKDGLRYHNLGHWKIAKY